MAVSTHTRRVLSYAVKSMGTGDEIADVIDAGSGTLSDRARAKIKRECGHAGAGDQIADAIDAGTALSDYEEKYLAFMLKNRTASDDIASELAS